MASMSIPGWASRSIAGVVLGLGTAGLLGVAAPSAYAIPGDGAGANTAGTSASASPRSLTAGSTLRFTVAGFPAGEVVYVKIDDGQFCSAKAVHGACVVHQARLSASGSASGSFVLPGDLKPGRHWLRFLASKEMTDSAGNYLGVKGYTTRRGSDFTIVAGAAVGGSAAGGTPATGAAGSAVGATALAAGETLVLAAPAESTPASTPASTPSSTPGSASADPEASEAEGSSAMSASEKASIEAAVDAALASPGNSDNPDTPAVPAEVTVSESGFPWVGSVGLAVMVGAAGAWAMRVRALRAARTRG